VTFEAAVRKALIASDLDIRPGTPVLLSLADRSKPEAVPLVRALHQANCPLYATRGTADLVASLGIPVTYVTKLADDGSRYSWVVTYGPKSDAEQRRAYEIAAVDAAHGHYVIDEKNGLKIDAWLVANQIFAPFEIEGSLIAAKYIRMNGGIVMELPSFATDKRRRTCLESNRNTCAHSYRMTGVQLCFLRPAK